MNMGWIELVAIYVGMAILTGVLYASTYFQKPFRQLSTEEMDITIAGIIFWPICLPFVIVNLLGNVTLAIQSGIITTTESRKLAADERRAALRERQLAIQKLEHELGMPLSQEQNQNLNF